MENLIVVCIGGEEPWAICCPSKDKISHVYYRVLERYLTYTEATKAKVKLEGYYGEAIS